jgi:hypothetical protein
MPVRGRGRGRGGGGAQRKPNPAQKTMHVARPAVTELPPELQVQPSNESIPAKIVASFPEFAQPQAFYTALERLRPELAGQTDAYHNCWVGLPDAEIKSIQTDDENGFFATLIKSNDESHPVFVKRIHLLDPMTSMEGGYVFPDEGCLPAPSQLWKPVLQKLNDPLNEAYVDALFASQASLFLKKSPHWLRCFGTYVARVEKYLYNITDEYDSLKNRPWWRRNQRLGLFRLFKDEDAQQKHQEFLTTGLTDLGGEDFQDLSDLEDSPSVDGSVDSGSEPEHTGESVKLTQPKVRLQRLTDPSSDESDASDDMSSDCSEDEIQQFAEFNNYPVQVQLLEKADGTMDELLDLEDEEEEAAVGNETKDDRWSAWIFQVIAALTEAQHWFGFVHNDLHTNNVMWNAVSDSHVYYRVHKAKETWYMRVPTFGKLMKIIDFGRASFTIPGVGFFISDAFYPGNDAAEQYNCEPFYDPEDGPKVEPNTSFDLARLSISLLESLYPERPAAVSPVKVMSREGAKLYSETVSGVYNLLWDWLQDDEGKNILRGPDGEERYPDFDLYKVLAANVHKAVPARQIEKPVFSKYRCLAKDLPKDAIVYDLHM